MTRTLFRITLYFNIWLFTILKGIGIGSTVFIFFGPTSCIDWAGNLKIASVMPKRKKVNQEIKESKNQEMAHFIFLMNSFNYFKI